MKKIVLPFLYSVFILIIVSCGSGGYDYNGNKHGKVEYGGTFNFSEVEPIRSTYPFMMSDRASAKIGYQIYEGLVKLDAQNDLNVIGALAESWEATNNNTIFTFKLKKGVHFPNDDCFDGGSGREITANDFIFCFEKLCTPDKMNDLFNYTFHNIVKGADAFYQGKTKSISGLKALDDYTLVIELNNPSRSFLYKLAYPGLGVFPHEAYERDKYNLSLGAGPFVYDKTLSNKDLIVLTRNENYHGKDTLDNKLPFLDTVKMHVIKNKKEELRMFEHKELDIISSLEDKTWKSLVEKKTNNFKEDKKKNKNSLVFEYVPQMVTHYYEFNTKYSVFKDKRIRQAFSHAVDRRKIVKDILKNEPYGAGIYGISPPKMSNYNIKKIQGYDTLNLDLARKLLADAGYPNGEGFPAINILINGNDHKNIVVFEEIERQLKNHLNVTLNLTLLSISKKLESAKYAQADIYRAGWLADFPSPENFLYNYYGKDVPSSQDSASFPNTTRYTNDEFDKLFDKALTCDTEEKANEYFMKAEQILINDAPLIVLWYDGFNRLRHAEVGGFQSNPMDYWDLSLVHKIKI